MNISRKIAAASISGTFFALILGFIFPNPFGDQDVATFKGYFFLATSSALLYMLYSFPVILIYGVITSIVSDKIAELITNKAGRKQAEVVVSGMLHLVFGFILLWFSLGASILYFVTDRILKARKNSYEWLDGLKSFTFPIVTWLLLMAIVWGKEIIFS